MSHLQFINICNICRKNICNICRKNICTCNNLFAITSNRKFIPINSPEYKSSISCLYNYKYSSNSTLQKPVR